ncbi:MAG: hypothetical protein IJI60_02540 [Bacilli bacterium]|nr:hypothetical protein [Bacilli bacterium]
MKKITYGIIIFILMFTMNVKAKEITASSIPNGAYVIGTHEFTRDKAQNYSGTLTIQHIMLAAKTISSDRAEDMKIYYKNSRGTWVDPITNKTLSSNAVPTAFDIEYINLAPEAEAQTHESTEYLITYNLNGGLKGTNSPTKGEVDQVIAVDKPTKNFTINFDANSQGARIENQSGEAITSVRGNQSFIGWTASNLNTSALYGTTTNPTTIWNGTTAIGENNDSIYFKNLGEVEEVVTLVANWNVTNIILPTVAKTDYICTYNTQANGQGTSYLPGDEYIPSRTTSSTTLYVVCEEVLSFENNTWTTIISNVQNGHTEGYHVGDTKEIDLGEELGTHTLRIANKSTPDECESQGFSQTACGFVVEFTDIIAMESMNTNIQTGNVGGWAASSMRTYLNTDIYNALPTELKNGVIDTTVVSGHGSTVGEENFVSSDKLYLLSSHEVVEDVDNDNTTGIDYIDTAYYSTRQLDYYEALEVTTTDYEELIKQYDGSDSAWWLRFAYIDDAVSFYRIDPTGAMGNNFSDYQVGVSPAFRIGTPTAPPEPTEEFAVGDYFTMTPDATTYEIPDTLTGISGEDLTPSELNLWRVISTSNGVEAVSVYVSSVNVTLDGEKGFLNLVKNLQTISEQYAKEDYTTATRIVGYNGQTQTVSRISYSTESTPVETSGIGQEYGYGVRGDTLYLRDYQLLESIGATIANKVGTSTPTSYWLASRNFYYTVEVPTAPEGDPVPSVAPYYYFNGRSINTSGSLATGTIYSRDSSGGNAPVSFGSNEHAIRPIIKLDSNVVIMEGNGTQTSPYTLSLETD